MQTSKCSLAVQTTCLSHSDLEGQENQEGNHAD